ncbi:hypothetical protein ACN42_g5483 [Penicillium freii]|uniref:Uncharacterized protein n=1 Tax=Penicillium freii TaxID=48697 RepID=A0A101MJL1_PENFR|nr:hypothetical protein ACN42_g5483 [Penicillium freii]
MGQRASLARTEIYLESLTLSALIKAAAAKIGKPHPAEEIWYVQLPRYLNFLLDLKKVTKAFKAAMHILIETEQRPLYTFAPSYKIMQS